jgi:hypothetical protein
MSNATLSSPWLIVLDLWGCWLFVMGFVKPLTLVVGLVLLVVGFTLLVVGFTFYFWGYVYCHMFKLLI